MVFRRVRNIFWHFVCMLYVVESASQVLSVHCIALVFLSLFWIFSFCRHRINQENSSLIISCARDSDSIYSKLGWIWKNVFQNLIFVKPRRMDVSVRYVFSPLVSPLLFLQTALFLEKKILYLFRSSLTDIVLRNNVWSWTLHCRYLSPSPPEKNEYSLLTTIFFIHQIIL